MLTDLLAFVVAPIALSAASVLALATRPELFFLALGAASYLGCLAFGAAMQEASLTVHPSREKLAPVPREYLEAWQYEEEVDAALKRMLGVVDPPRFSGL